MGCYTSPHLLAYNERVRIDGEPVSDQALITAFEAVEAAREQVPLTYFEFGTLAALYIFLRSGLDLMVLEVGLGGRLDAVNIIDPDLAIITSISEDHQSWLGDDRDSIGREKAGILRPGIAAVIADPDPPSTLVQRLDELGCSSIYHEPALAGRFSNRSLRGENAAAAWRAAEILGFAPDLSQAVALVQEIELPGRLQHVALGTGRVLLDVAHNPAAVANLANYLETQVSGRCLALFAALSDKDIHAMIQSCCERFDAWFVTELPGVKRAAPARDTAAVLRSSVQGRVVVCRSPQKACTLAQNEMQADDTLVIFGSFYTIAALLPILEEERSRA